MAKLCKLICYVGLMGSGKSNELIKDYFNLDYTMRNSTKKWERVAVTPDIKESRKIQTRNKTFVKIEDCISMSELVQKDLYSDTDYFIFIDETQFVTYAQMRFLLRISMMQNIYVTLSTLPTDYEDNPWEPFLELLRWRNNPECIFPENSYRDITMQCDMCWEEKLNKLDSKLVNSYYLEFMSEADKLKYDDYISQYKDEYTTLRESSIATRIIRLTNSSDRVVLDKSVYKSVCAECAKKVLDKQSKEPQIPDKEGVSVDNNESKDDEIEPKIISPE